MKARNFWMLAAICLVMSALIMTGCGSSAGGLGGGPGAVNCAGCGSTAGGGTTGGSGSTTSSPVTVTLLSDPNCIAANSASHLYISVAGVQVNPDKAATGSSTGWLDLAPALSSNPVQLDLFNLNLAAGNLGSSTVQDGTFGSIRLLLASNNSSVASNKCSSVTTTNCYVLPSGSTLPVFVATETTSGIVINNDQMLKSGIAIGGSGSNVNVLFNSCSSLLFSQGGYRLIPKATAWSGAFQLYNVQVTDAVTGAAIPGAQVSLQTLNAAAVQDVISEGVTDGGGNVSLPGPNGTFDIVAAGENSLGVANIIYGPLAVTGVTGSGASTAVAAKLQSYNNVLPAILLMNVQSNVTIDGRLRALQSGTINGLATKNFVIPFVNSNSYMDPIETGPASNCTPNSCLFANLTVPAEPLYVQPFNGTATASTSAPSVSIAAEAFRSQLAGVRNCTLTEVTTSPVPVSPKVAVSVPTITFSGCL